MPNFPKILPGPPTLQQTKVSWPGAPPRILGISNHRTPIHPLEDHCKSFPVFHTIFNIQFILLRICIPLVSSQFMLYCNPILCYVVSPINLEGDKYDQLYSIQIISSVFNVFSFLHLHLNLQLFLC